MADDMNFSNFKVYQEVKEAYKAAKYVADNPQKNHWLVMMGSNDTGKTHLAISICKAWINKGIPSKYSFVPLLLDELREGFGKDGNESYTERFKRFCNVPLLVLDDLGAEVPKPWVQEKLETLIDYRLMNKLSLVVTTNKSMDELSPRMSSRLVRHPDSILIAISASEYTMRRSRK